MPAGLRSRSSCLSFSKARSALPFTCSDDGCAIGFGLSLAQPATRTMDTMMPQPNPPNLTPTPIFPRFSSMPLPPSWRPRQRLSQTLHYGTDFIGAQYECRRYCRTCTSFDHDMTDPAAHVD